jgi:8-oxo-dGTP diphosphatase
VIHTPQDPAMIDAAVAVVQRADGRVLLAQRPAGKPSAGYWEFPGGKIEAGEDAARAVARELHEEVGIEVMRAFPWLTREHAYTDRRVRLHFYRVTAWHGEPHGREGQPLSWQDPRALTVGPLLPANDKVLGALRLPSLYAISHAARYGVDEFLRRLAAALAGGVRLLQLREPDMPPEAFERFAREAVALAHAQGARVLISRDAALSRRTGADGVHVSGRQLLQLPRAPDTPMWAASCHDAIELARAAELGADFVVLSQVLPTATHPGVAGMGWERFAALVRGYPLPVFALGGMRRDTLETAMDHGAHGIGLLGGIW